MKVLYTGSFNPFHNGHQYVYDMACKCFGKENVWIGIGINPNKKTVDQGRLEYSIHPITKNVLSYSCMTAEVVKEKGFELLVRGIRPGQSLDEENNLLYWNRRLTGGVETILIPTPPEVNQISSGAIREMDSYGQNVSEYMNDFVFGRWKRPNYDWIVYFGRCCSGKSTFIKGESVRRFDKLIWDNLGKVDSINVKQQVKKAFYAKDSSMFKWFSELIGDNANWEKMFSNSNVIDFPNLGTYWKHIPKNIITRCKFIKITASMEDRTYFSDHRKANPELIETSDYFYQDPPFWDEEIVIKKKPQ